MKRVALLAGPVVLVGAIAGAAFLVHRRRASRRRARAPHVEVSLPDERVARAASVGAGVELLAGYDELHEAEEEARHGALLHIEVSRLSVGQI